MMPPGTPLLDTHVHVWDTAALDHPWLDGPPLPPRCLPGDVDRAGGRTTRMVFVEADPGSGLGVAEARWVAGLDWPELAGIVAHVDPGAGDELVPALDELGGIGRVVGVRRVLQGAPADTWPADALADGLRELGRRGLTFDACVRATQLEALADLLERVPGTAVVLDHLGKPPVDAGIDSPAGRAWTAGIARVAALDHVHVKLSGLAAEAKDATSYAAHADAFLDAALTAFGPDRAMIGSDWPVSARMGAGTTTAAWADRVQRATGATGADWTGIAEGNGARFYALA